MPAPSDPSPPQAVRWQQFAAEAGLVFLLFFLQGSSLPPDVNEAHYLVKAKHYWNPAFCAGDVFCESADAHAMFYLTFGLLTKWLSLSTAAWTGRILGWLILAVTWTRLAQVVTPGKWRAFLSAAVVLVLWQRTHLGGEWVVGGMEAKIMAYGFVFLAVADWCSEQWRRALLLAGVGAAFHVLVGGWTLVAFGVAWLLLGNQRPKVRELLPSAIAAVVVAAPGWWPALALARGVDAATLNEAYRIYVYERLSHHLVFHRFDHTFMLRHGALVVATVALWRYGPTSAALNRLYGVVAGAAAIAVAGIVLDQSLLYFPELSAKLLRFYFYRLSDAFIPIAAAMGLLAWLSVWEKSRPAWFAAGLATIMAITSLHFAGQAYEQRADHLPAAVLQSLPRTKQAPLRFWNSDAISTDESPPEEQPYIAPPNPLDIAANRAEWFRQWQGTCRWIKQSTAPSDRFLTPRHQQTFKWYAERPEVVNWKDMPQDAKSLVVWFNTWNVIHPYENGISDLAGFSDERLRELGKTYGAKYVVIDRTRFQRPITLVRVYPTYVDQDSLFAVYRLD